MPDDAPDETLPRPTPPAEAPPETGDRAGTMLVLAVSAVLLLGGLALMVALPYRLLLPRGTGMPGGAGVVDLPSASGFWLLPITHWSGLLLTMVGIAVLLSQLIPIDAKTEGPLRILGQDVPVRIGGAAFLVLILLFCGGLVTTSLDLDDFEARHSEFENMRAAQGDLERLRSEHEAFRTILMRQIETNSARLMRLRIECGGAVPIYFASWPGEPEEGYDEYRAVITPQRGDRSFLEQVRPIPIMADRHSFAIYGDGKKVLETRFELLEGRFIVATISPGETTLAELCESLTPFAQYGGDAVAESGDSSQDASVTQVSDVVADE